VREYFLHLRANPGERRQAATDLVDRNLPKRWPQEFRDGSLMVVRSADPPTRRPLGAQPMPRRKVDVNDAWFIR
jgi:hypothetical protein